MYKLRSLFENSGSRMYNNTHALDDTKYTAVLFYASLESEDHYLDPENFPENGPAS
jgi:hypothetical protein